MRIRAIAFAVALIMLIFGIVGSGPIVTAIGDILGRHARPTTLETPQSPSPSRSWQSPSPERFPITPGVELSPAPHRMTPSGAPAIPRTTSSRARPRFPVGPHVVAGLRSAPSEATSTPSPESPGAANPGTISGFLPAPVPVATRGTVRLVNNWLQTVHIRRGQTVSLVYVIDNGTGTAARLWLGASIKRSQLLDWATSAINDPTHDLVVLAPPGTSIQVRFFTLAPSLRPGLYDVAWGVRDAETGQRVALVTAPRALQVLH